MKGDDGHPPFCDEECRVQELQILVVGCAISAISWKCRVTGRGVAIGMFLLWCRRPRSGAWCIGGGSNKVAHWYVVALIRWLRRG